MKEQEKCIQKKICVIQQQSQTNCIWAVWFRNERLHVKHKNDKLENKQTEEIVMQCKVQIMEMQIEKNKEMQKQPKHTKHMMDSFP